MYVSRYCSCVAAVYACWNPYFFWPRRTHVVHVKPTLAQEFPPTSSCSSDSDMKPREDPTTIDGTSSARFSSTTGKRSASRSGKSSSAGGKIRTGDVVKSALASFSTILVLFIHYATTQLRCSTSSKLPLNTIFLLFSLVFSSFAATTGLEAVIPCSNEGSICSENSASICRNGTCVSACALRGMSECVCDAEEDNYCYLCCGNHHHQCLPAHHHNILRPNGERWEREACSRCRMHGAELEGLPCDDVDPARLCINAKCSNSVCHTKQPGSFCDRKMEKLCVDNVCENPCSRFASHLMVCDCPSIDQDTGFASEDRCQLCCYDFNLKPTNRRCQNAYRKYKIMDAFAKPIWRVGLECAGGKTCNRYGVCAGSQHFSSSIVFVLVPLIILICFT